MRELGGASTQILDDVQSRLDYLAKTKFVSVYPGVDTSKGYTYTEELTSRMSNSEITEIIQVKLKRGYTKDNHADVFDYLLASNMISVGVDVGRLGAMVVAGQPKTNAEYIQATSRVGRDNPGLVIAVYNASRSRDRSHYEQFLKYHSALYRYVEATSLTPFSDRARDRGLHALYVSLCRYLIENLRGNSQAINYRSDNPEIQKVEKIIIDYVRRVDPDSFSAPAGRRPFGRAPAEKQTRRRRNGPGQIGNPGGQTPGAAPGLQADFPPYSAPFRPGPSCTSFPFRSLFRLVPPHRCR